MLEKQRQTIGDNSTGIQVKGDYIAGNTYTEIKSIFLDLFELNFPKIQQIAQDTANERISRFLDDLRDSLEKHSSNINPLRFTDPLLQYEMQSIAINVARRGENSNTNILAELLCSIASNECTELTELITTESLKIVSMLNKTHLAYLSAMVVITQMSFTVNTAKDVDIELQKYLDYVSESNAITNKDIQYIACTRAIESTAHNYSDRTPYALVKIPELNFESEYIQRPHIIKYCKDNKLDNILRLWELSDKCLVGHYHLMATGYSIGSLNLSHLADKKA